MILICFAVAAAEKTREPFVIPTYLFLLLLLMQVKCDVGSTMHHSQQSPNSFEVGDRLHY